MSHGGGYSLIKCEANLIKDVVNSGGDYTYVHLISGLDLPIKSQDYIHSYFDEHKGEEFVEFMNDSWINNNIRRFKYYYPLQDIAGKQSRIVKNILYIFQCCIVKIQQFIGINRLKKIGVEFKAGSQWFSITFECAKYILDKWPDYRKVFKCANCADEFFVQTIIASSVFYNNRHKAEVADGHHENMRLIEWISGPHPKTYTIEDIDQIVSSDLLFARKFDEDIDDKVIDQIIEIVTK
ncbi:MAG: beta-1,6-N-acetylglucosaminyltransferase [Lachnospiraceae bacterium]|nr:beta-1,6-N-acetylglucosaminyltransferase [Lachnospiraceae bacterium]MCI9470695.1 beta-1,6-N-acetylglucosaminyltransferase [Lachnospiraceae bacterium]